MSSSFAYCDTDFLAYKMPAYRMPVCKPMSEEWKSSLPWWGVQNNIDTPGIAASAKEAAKMAKMFILRDKILGYGGENVCLPIVEEDYEKIMQRGIIMPLRSRMMKGRPSRCHENSALCWEVNKDTTRICTGYALSEDGMWRQHTWILHMYRTYKGYQKAHIIETTEKRVAYFGFIMTRDECSDFAYWNT